MKEHAAFHDKKRLFYSDLRNVNLLDCIVSKVKVVQVISSLNLHLAFYFCHVGIIYIDQRLVLFDTFAASLLKYFSCIPLSIVCLISMLGLLVN